MLNQKSDKILIVEDEPEIAQALRIYLEDEGYVCSLASKGSVALDILLSEKDYSVVLLDIKMRGMDGITVLKRLHDTGTDTSVIMMSGHGSEEMAVECMRNGAEDYISKPFAFEDLLMRIERARTHRVALIEKRQMEQEREDFILMLSHDMKNPLTAAIGSIDIICEGCLGEINDEQRDYLKSAIDSCNEVVVMIDNLLDIRKFEAGKLQMTNHPCDANELINKIARQFARAAENDDIKFSIDLEPGIAEIVVDKKSFGRVLGNLFGNALKFTPVGGAISVSCRSIEASQQYLLHIPDYVLLPSDFNKTGRFIKITVADSGNGIPYGELDRIFDRYTQFTRKTGRERGGAGLGLAYCKLAIESFHGMIWAESKSDEGSTFVILLPKSSNTGE